MKNLAHVEMEKTIFDSSIALPSTRQRKQPSRFSGIVAQPGEEEMEKEEEEEEHSKEADVQEEDDKSEQIEKHEGYANDDDKRYDSADALNDAVGSISLSPASSAEHLPCFSLLLILLQSNRR